MRIDFISEHASPLATLGGADAGGQNVHVAELGAALVRAGHEVTVYTRRDDPALARVVDMQSGLRVVHVDAGPATPIVKDRIFDHIDEFASRLRKAWAERRPDLAHAHFWMSGRAALVAAARYAIPVVQTFHALGIERRREQGAADSSPAARIDIEREIAISCDRVIATSSSEIFELCRLGADPRKLKIVPCGVDVAGFDESGDRSIVAALPPRRAKHRLITLSRLVPRKGVGNVIEALASIPDTELAIAGGPREADLDGDAEVARLRAISRDCGVADRVRFLGRVGREAVPSVLRSADLVVCAAWYEPFGIVPLEAMAAGVPVVATAVGGQNDSIIDRFTGLHVPPRNPAAIAQAVNELLADAPLRARMGRAGGQRVRSRYSWDRIAAETLRVYRGIDTATAPASESVSNSA